MLRRIVKFILITEAFATLTFGFGWWMVPAFAFVLGVALDRKSRPVAYAMWGAAAGWLTLLLLDAARGPIGILATRFGGVMRVPGPLILIITLLFPALLAWSASAIGAFLRSRFVRATDSEPHAQSVREEPATARSTGEVAVADV
jgi:hypothetical protein